MAELKNKGGFVFDFMSIFSSGMDIVAEAPVVYTTWINKISGGNEFLAGTLGISALGAITYSLRSIPVTLHNIISRRLVVSMTIDSTATGYNALRTKLQSISGGFGSRDFTMVTNDERSSKYMNSFKSTCGLGSHYFFYKRVLFWYTISDLDSAGVTMQKKRIVLKAFSIGKSCIDDLLYTLEEPMEHNAINFYNCDGNGEQSHITCVRPQTLDEICLDNEVKKYIKQTLDDFKDSKDKKRKLGIPNKLVLLLHGEPGNGKSKLIPAIAQYLQRNVNNINVAGLRSADGFQKSIKYGNELHVLEDIHSLSTLKDSGSGVTYVKKENTSGAKKTQKRSTQKGEAENYSGNIELSEFLNILNGSVPLNGQVIVMTTNYIDDLDQAILRPGRTDHVIKLPRIKKETANKWLKEKIPGLHPSVGFTKAVRGCDLGGLLQVTNGDPDKIAIQIPVIDGKIPEEQFFNFNDANNIEFD